MFTFIPIIRQRFLDFPHNSKSEIQQHARIISRLSLKDACPLRVNRRTDSPFLRLLIAAKLLTFSGPQPNQEKTNLLKDIHKSMFVCLGVIKYFCITICPCSMFVDVVSGHAPWLQSKKWHHDLLSIISKKKMEQLV